jgi:saccharopine dehydrogenase (NAD+, L-lysine-forming)
MRVVVLGAAGAMAQVVIRDLLTFVPDVEITAADARPLERRGPLADPRVRSASCDVRNVDATAALLRGHGAVLNCVTYYFNLDVMRAALAAGVPYTDLGGLYHGSLRQFAMDGEFAAAGVPAVLGMGSTPGITNVMAGALARQMDSVQAAHVRVGCADATVSGPLPVPYALDTVLDEFALEPMVLADGAVRAVRPMSGAEAVDFPLPVGRMEAFYTLHSEVAMFPRAFPGLRDASFKVAFAADLVTKMRFLVELGLASRENLVRDVSPREMLLAVVARQPQPDDATPADCDALTVEVRGTRDGRPVVGRGVVIALPHAEWGLAAGAVDTGVPLSIVGQMLAAGTIRTPGVLSPELHVPADLFFAELARRGMRAELTVEDVA